MELYFSFCSTIQSERTPHTKLYSCWWVIFFTHFFGGIQESIVTLQRYKNCLTSHIILSYHTFTICSNQSVVGRRRRVFVQFVGPLGEIVVYGFILQRYTTIWHKSNQECVRHFSHFLLRTSVLIDIFRIIKENKQNECGLKKGNFWIYNLVQINRVDLRVKIVVF